MADQILKVIFLSLFIRLSVTAPVDTSANSAQPSTFVGYVSEPNVRGTTSLVLSCFLTLVLCVWSALHLNVPQQDSTQIQNFLCNIRWIITGVYAPELVVFTAWRQWASARLLGKLISRLSKELKTKTPTTAPISPTIINRELSTSSLGQRTLYNAATFADRRNKWTKTHDFFATTGGFSFEIPSGPDSVGKSVWRKFLPETSPTRLTLTARGVALLAKCNRLPDVPEKDILDKSKASNLAKALVVIQASWILLQTVGRITVGLPVTLLEVNTMAHVGCVFVMYILWWNKPLLPNEPFILSGDWVDPLCAFMYMSSDMSGEIQKKKSQTMIKTMFAFLDWYSRIPEIDMIALRLQPPLKNMAEEESQTSLHTILPFFQSASTSTACIEELHAKQLEKAADTAFFERRPKVKGSDLNMGITSPITSRRWALALQAINDYPVILEEHTMFRHEGDTCVHFKAEELLVRRVQNWPSNDLLRDVGGLTVGMVLWMASFVYGGIHAAAWNYQFPSDPEKWIWRSSALYIGFCGGFWIILNYFAQIYRPLNDFWEGWMDGKARWYLTAVIWPLVFICGLSFCLARLFIVVEAVASIRKMPASAYVTPDWTQVFPHL